MSSILRTHVHVGGGRARKIRPARLACLLGVSLLVHLGLLSLLVLQPPARFRFRQDQDTSSMTAALVHLSDLAPRQADRSKDAAPANDAAISAHRVAAPIARPKAQDKTRAPPPAIPPPSPLRVPQQQAPAAQGGPPSAPGTDASSGAEGPGGAAPTRGAVSHALQAMFRCQSGNLSNLSPEDRASCEQRIGREANNAGPPVDTVPPEKRKYYDAIQQAYQSLHDIRPQFNLAGQRVLAGHPPAVGCKFGKGYGIKCRFIPPQGFLTEEAGIPKPK
ncbi:hypothetical protein [Caulobacter sp. S45]|uniref:hypothetical protein n=1 Tax=Caulobacter sp. S45 TaxID=1641861 RepID=UPI00131E2FCC|nr:hypothetical protein [Caulobacter sp. S45]